MSDLSAYPPGVFQIELDGLKRSAVTFQGESGAGDVYTKATDQSVCLQAIDFKGYIHSMGDTCSLGSYLGLEQLIESHVKSQGVAVCDSCDGRSINESSIEGALASLEGKSGVIVLTLTTQMADEQLSAQDVMDFWAVSGFVNGGVLFRGSDFTENNRNIVVKSELDLILQSFSLPFGDEKTRRLLDTVRSTAGQVRLWHFESRKAQGQLLYDSKVKFACCDCGALSYQAPERVILMPDGSSWQLAEFLNSTLAEMLVSLQASKAREALEQRRL